MRNYETEHAEFPGNCGITVIYAFQHVFPEGSIDDYWFAQMPEEEQAMRYSIAFSGIKQQEKDEAGPFAFAKWLEKKGQTVFSTPWARNPSSTNRFKMFYCNVTKAFAAKSIAAQKRIEKKEEKEDSRY